MRFNVIGAALAALLFAAPIQAQATTTTMMSEDNSGCLVSGQAACDDDATDTSSDRDMLLDFIRGPAKMLDYLDAGQIVGSGDTGGAILSTIEQLKSLIGEDGVLEAVRDIVEQPLMLNAIFSGIEPHLLKWVQTAGVYSQVVEAVNDRRVIIELGFDTATARLAKRWIDNRCFVTEPVGDVKPASLCKELGPKFTETFKGVYEVDPTFKTAQTLVLLLHRQNRAGPESVNGIMDIAERIAKIFPAN